MTKRIAIFLLGFIIPVTILLILYFTVINKKVCKGDLYKCPASDVELCVNSDTSDTEWKAMCANLGTGGGGYVPTKTSNNHLGLTGGMYGQNNPDEIARNMANICGEPVGKEAVDCALALSAFETTKPGWPLFSDDTFINDYNQDLWCLGKPTPKPNYPIKGVTKSSC